MVPWLRFSLLFSKLKILRKYSHLLNIAFGNTDQFEGNQFELLTFLRLTYRSVESALDLAPQNMLRTGCASYFSSLGMSPHQLANMEVEVPHFIELK